MAREKSEYDVLGRITEERQKRGWTEYTLAKNAGITQSTISGWYRNQLTPSIPSLERICKGLGISMAQFFSPIQSNQLLTEDQEVLLCEWSRLNPTQRQAIIALLKTLH